MTLECQETPSENLRVVSSRSPVGEGRSAHGAAQSGQAVPVRESLAGDTVSTEHFAIMGSGEVGMYLARSLAAEGHRVTLIDPDPAKRQLVEEQLDVAFVRGNAAHIPVLRAAGVNDCSLFVAASSSDEANLAASLLAKQEGARRTVVRVSTSDDITRFGQRYEQAFQADLLLSTQLLTTTQILNAVLGYNTLEVEYLAGGSLQIRRTHIEAGSPLEQKRLADVGLPRGCLILAFIRDGQLQVPKGDDSAQPGDDVLFVAMSEVIEQVERTISHRHRHLGTVVVVGGGSTAEVVSERLQGQADRVQLIERDRSRAEDLAARFPGMEVLHGDGTDMSLLSSEGVGGAKNFLALTGNDETNLMACLLAEELGAKRLTALVQKSETSTLWRRIGRVEVVSPRTLAAERIRSYISNGYEPHIISFENGTAQFIQRKVEAVSPVAGALLAEVEIPDGLIVAAVISNGKAIVPRGDQRLEVGDEVVLFVLKDEATTAYLLFPGPESG